LNRGGLNYIAPPAPVNSKDYSTAKDYSTDEICRIEIASDVALRLPRERQLCHCCKIPTIGDGVLFMNASLPITSHGDDPGQNLDTRDLPSSAQPRSLALAAHPTRHAALVRVTHWIATLAFLALLVSGAEIVLSHPRFYWGETGNVNMHPWLNLHLPSSRDTVPTGYGYVLPDQNGWSRYLHFQAAWLAVATGLLYLLLGFFAGHFRRNLFPAPSDLSLKNLGNSIIRHLRFERPAAEEAWSYNVLQRLSYLVVIFVLFPLMIWTGLAMSFGFDSAFPLAVRLLGGQQTARSLHFLATILLVLFLFVHVLMVVLAGFRNRMRAMISGTVITGRATRPTE
jgi:thiosulfate reductase cytochrome b subunit